MTFRLGILLFLAELDSITHLDPSIVIPVLLKLDVFFKDNDFSVLPIFPFLYAIAFCTAHYGVQRLKDGIQTKSPESSVLIGLESTQIPRNPVHKMPKLNLRMQS